MLCNYGCGKDGIYQLKNGKYCCSENYRKCEGIRRKTSEKLKGKPKSEEHKNKMKKPKTEDHKQKLRKPSEKKKLSWTTERKEKQKEYMLNGGSTHLNSFITKDSIKKLKESVKSAWKNPSKFNIDEFKERSKNQCLNGHSILMNSIPRDPEKLKKETIRKRNQLLNGQALKMIKAIKKISKPETKLRDMIRILYPECEYQYPVFRYSLDVAIPKYKIAIEYDGWFHFDTKEHILYHENRTNKIIKEGWKIIKYSLYDKFPNLEKVKKDIEKLIGENSGNSE